MTNEIFNVANSPLIFSRASQYGEPTEYNRAPNTDLALGRSFDPVDFTSIKRPGIKFTETRLDHGTPQARFEFLYVSNYESFTSELKLDRNVQASYLGNSIGSASTLNYDNSFASNSINVIVKVWADYGRWSLDPEADLTEPAKALLHSNPAEFAHVYGTRFVATESRMNAIYAVITIYSASATLKRRLEETLSVGIGIGPLGGIAKQTVISELKSITDQDRISINAFTIGGDGVGQFKDLIATSIKHDQDPLKSIAESISKTIGNMDSKNAVPYSFVVGDMRNFGLLQQPEIVWSPERAWALVALRDMYDRTMYKLEILKGIKAKTHPIYWLIGDAQAHKLDPDIEACEVFVRDVGKRHLNCRRNISPESYVVPKSPWLLLDLYLPIAAPTPTIEFLGNYSDAPEAAIHEIRPEILAIILNTSPARRRAVIDGFFPNNEGVGVTISPSGFGLSAFEMFDELRGRIPRTGQNWTTKVITYTGTPGVGFVMFRSGSTEDLETQILSTIPSKRPVVVIGERVQFEYSLWCRLTDKANRKFAFLMMKCSMSAVYDVDGARTNVDIEYFPMGRYHD